MLCNNREIKGARGWLGSIKFNFLSSYEGNLIGANVELEKWDKRPLILLGTILLGI